MAESTSTSKAIAFSNPLAPSGTDEAADWIFEHCPVGILRVVSGRLTHANPSLVNLLGWTTAEEMMADSSFCSALLRACQPTKMGEAAEREVTLRRKDGSTLKARLAGNSKSLTDDRNAFIAFVTNASERTYPEDSLHDLQKKALIGQLAEDAAHSFNNMIAAVLINLDLQLREPLISPTQGELLGELRKEAKSAATLTRQLINFSRRSSSSKPEVFTLSELVGGVAKMLGRLLRGDSEIVFQASPDQTWIHADPAQLEQIVIQLCLLARESKPGGGKLTLTIGLADFSRLKPDRPAQAPKGQFVYLGVMSANNPSRSELEKGPFPATSSNHHIRPSLADLQAEISRQNGWLEVDSSSDTASSLRAYFPASAKPSARPDVPGRSEVGEAGSETVLLVENESSLRRATTTSLRRMGYAVFDAGHGDEALNLWKEHRAIIDMLFSDLFLPGPKSGLDLAQQMLSEKPSLRVVLASGHRRDLELCQLKNGQEITRLPKPYDQALLAKVLRECFESPESPCLRSIKFW